MRAMQICTNSMDPETFRLIRKICFEFKLQADIELTCYEAYNVYFKHYFLELKKRVQHKTISYGELIDRTLDEVEETTLLHILALVSICAKYVNGYRCENLFTRFPKYLQQNGTPFSTDDIRNSEFIVFKYLDFNIKPSELYVTAIELARSVIRHRDYVNFERLHDRCVTMLRMIYLYRQKIDEILSYVEQNTYGYNGNEVMKLAAATIYASANLTYPQQASVILNEIVRRTYLNESFLRKLGQSIQDFYVDQNKYQDAHCK